MTGTDADTRLIMSVGIRAEQFCSQATEGGGAVG